MNIEKQNPDQFFFPTLKAYFKKHQISLPV